MGKAADLVAKILLQVRCQQSEAAAVSLWSPRAGQLIDNQSILYFGLIIEALIRNRLIENAYEYAYNINMQHSEALMP